MTFCRVSPLINYILAYLMCSVGTGFALAVAMLSGSLTLSHCLSALQLPQNKSDINAPSLGKSVFPFFFLNLSFFLSFLYFGASLSLLFYISPHLLSFHNFNSVLSLFWTLTHLLSFATQDLLIEIESKWPKHQSPDKGQRLPRLDGLWTTWDRRV